ncbi:hypothetical protein MKY34_16975 [Sporosarcina sp. FSL K6-1522]|uniref:hypothetical protein n=1 Tax=Sporosarcina sp. FSL K6-1522 TaxID=2921554 RepID=UPI00315A8272
MKKLLGAFFFSFIIVLSGCGEVNSVEPVLNVEQFSLVNQAFAKDKLGEPKSVDTWNYASSSTDAGIPLTTLEFDWDGYPSEFHFDDKDRLVRINIHENYNEESKFKKTTFEDLLQQLNITAGENMTKEAETAVAWRYERVSEKVDEIWVVGDVEEVGEIKITFDIRPFM